MHTEKLVVDDPFNHVEDAPSSQHQTEVIAPAGCQAPPCLQAASIVIEPARTSSHVPTWKNPSARVLTSRPANVSGECPSTSLTM